MMPMRATHLIPLLMLCLSAAPMAWGQPSDPASKYPDLVDMKMDGLKLELERASFFRDLRAAKSAIDGPRMCGRHIDKAKESRRSLIDLNSRFKNNPTDEYQRRAGDLKRNNERAILDYRNCFSEKMIYFPLLVEKGVSGYDSHKMQYQFLYETYKDFANLNDYIAAIKQAIEDLKGYKNDMIVATVISVFKGVEVKSGRSGADWKTISGNYELRLSDRIRTGPRGGARLRLDDRIEQGEGPTVIHIGSDTEILMKEFHDRDKYHSPHNGIVDLIRGIIRANTRNWGSGSSFHIRTGTSLCGIRGTEVAVSFDPATDTAVYFLNHGDAFVEVGGRRSTLLPRTSITVKAEVASAPRPISQSEWGQLVSATQGTVSGNLQGNPRISASWASESFLHAMKYAKDAKTFLATTTGQLRQSLAGALKQETLESLNERTGDAPRSFIIRCAYCERESGACQVLADVEKQSAPPGQLAQMLLTTGEEAAGGRHKISRAFWGSDQQVSEYLGLNPQCLY